MSPGLWEWLGAILGSATLGGIVGFGLTWLADWPNRRRRREEVGRALDDLAMLQDWGRRLGREIAAMDDTDARREIELARQRAAERNSSIAAEWEAGYQRAELARQREIDEEDGRSTCEEAFYFSPPPPLPGQSPVEVPPMPAPAKVIPFKRPRE